MMGPATREAEGKESGDKQLYLDETSTKVKHFSFFLDTIRDSFVSSFSSHALLIGNQFCDNSSARHVPGQ